MPAMTRKEGAAYKVVSSEDEVDAVNNDDIVYLIRDDLSDAPWFSKRKDATYHDDDVFPVSWSALEDYPQISITITATCEGFPMYIEGMRVQDMQGVTTQAYGQAFFLRYSTPEYALICPLHCHLDDCYEAPGADTMHIVGCTQSAVVTIKYIRPYEEDLTMSQLSTEQKLVNLELPVGDRILIEHGVLTEDGKGLTDEGKRIVLRYALKAHKQDIIDDLTKATETKASAAASSNDSEA